MSANLRVRLAAVRLLALDVDGVLTDGRIGYADAGGETKFFNVRDGHGLKRIMAAGIRVALITARPSPATASRARELGIEAFHEDVADKAARLREVAAAADVPLAACAYMGDDEPDLPALKAAGIAFAPADAIAAVREQADWCARANGGAGAVREACELLLAARDRRRQEP
jgi:3-deoxy-D-manno-octulosonate 8-phosphate phosphatase (KDO 8-P phosphatase)